MLPPAWTMILLHRGVGPSLYVIPKRASRELECSWRLLPPFQGAHRLAENIRFIRILVMFTRPILNCQSVLWVSGFKGSGWCYCNNKTFRSMTLNLEVGECDIFVWIFVAGVYEGLFFLWIGFFNKRRTRPREELLIDGCSTPGDRETCGLFHSWRGCHASQF